MPRPDLRDGDFRRLVENYRSAWLIAEQEEENGEFTTEGAQDIWNTLELIRQTAQQMQWQLQPDTDPSLLLPPMSDYEFDNAEEIEDDATPGPWTLEDETSAPDLGLSSYEYTVKRRGQTTIVRSSDPEQGWYDAKFIAEARDLLPKLCQEIRRLTAENDLLRRPVKSDAVQDDN